MMKPILLLTLVCLCILPIAQHAGALPTDNCHCFRDRSYDPADKFSADDYLLATSFNSLIAATLGVSKRQIVMMKMKGGIDPQELLIALYIAHAAGSDVDLLLSIRDNGGSWQRMVATPAVKNKAGADSVIAALAAGAADKEVSALIADAMFKARYNPSPEDLTTLHGQGFGDREINLILALHDQKAIPVQELVSKAKEKNMSWSEIANSLQLTPSTVGKNILNRHESAH